MLTEFPGHGAVGFAMILGPENWGRGGCAHVPASCSAGPGVCSGIQTRLGLQRTCNHTCGAGLTCTKARTEKDLATVLAAVPYSADARPDPTDLSTQAT